MLVSDKQMRKNMTIFFVITSRSQEWSFATPLPRSPRVVSSRWSWNHGWYIYGRRKMRIPPKSGLKSIVVCFFWGDVIEFFLCDASAKLKKEKDLLRRSRPSNCHLNSPGQVSSVTWPGCLERLVAGFESDFCDSEADLNFEGFMI